MKQEERAWPYWMRRSIAINTAEAFQDLISSVGGSPPYGGVSRDEARAVRELIKAHRGPGAVAPQALAAVRQCIGKDSEKLLTLKAFEVHDRVAADPENFSDADVREGIQLADQTGDNGLAAHFELLGAQFAHRNGDLDRAQALAAAAVTRLTSLVGADSAYAAPLGAAVANVTSFSALYGDFAVARPFAALALQMGYGEHQRDLMPALQAPPAHATSAMAAADRASDLLEAGQSLQALEWFALAKNLAKGDVDEKALCGALGDMAVAFRRVGNQRHAIATYRSAIELCRRHHDDLNLSRWCGNLGNLMLVEGDSAAARPLFEEAMAAAQHLSNAQQLAVARGNLAALLEQEGRHAESLQQMGKAQQGADAQTGELWRRRELDLQLAASCAARKRREIEPVRRAVAAGLALVREGTADEERIAASLLLERAAVEEACNDIVSVAATLHEAALRCDAAGDRAEAAKLREKAQQLDV